MQINIFKILHNRYKTKKNRFKMLFSKGIFKYVVLHLRVLKFLGTNLYSIKPIAYKLEVNHIKKIKKKVSCRCLLATLLLFIIVAQLYLFREKFPRVQQYEGFLYLVCLISFLSRLCVSFSRNFEDINIFNSLVKMEHQLKKGEITNIINFKKIVVHMSNIVLKFIQKIFWTHTQPVLI